MDVVISKKTTLSELAKDVELYPQVLKNVKVNGTSLGITEFICTYFDQLLTYGTAVGEIVLSADKTTIDSLYNASLKDIEIGYEDSVLSPIVYVKNGTTKAEKAPFQQLILLSLLIRYISSIKSSLKFALFLSILKSCFLSSIFISLSIKESARRCPIFNSSSDKNVFFLFEYLYPQESLIEAYF